MVPQQNPAKPFRDSCRILCRPCPPRSISCGRIFSSWLVVRGKDWSALTPTLSPRRGSAIQPSKQFIVFTAFDRGRNAEGNVPIFRALAALPLLGERAGVRASVFQSRCPDAPISCLGLLPRLQIPAVSLTTSSHHECCEQKHERRHELHDPHPDRTHRPLRRHGLCRRAEVFHRPRLLRKGTRQPTARPLPRRCGH